MAPSHEPFNKIGPLEDQAVRWPRWHSGCRDSRVR